MDMNRPTLKLIADAYKEDDPDKYWDIIRELHERGTNLEFDAARTLTKSDNSMKRKIGADILGQLCWEKDKFQEDSFQKESVQILISLLSDKNNDVIYSAAVALGHRKAEEAIPHLMKLKSHKDNSIRLGVVLGVTGYENLYAIDTLIELSKDSERDVRDWATFGLGTQCEVNTPELRTALKARLSDEDSEIRGEAIVGLANRKDKDIAKAILKELKSDETGVLVLEAATLIADKKFLPTLKKWHETLKNDDDSYFLNLLDADIKSCS